MDNILVCVVSFSVPEKAHKVINIDSNRSYIQFIHVYYSVIIWVKVACIVLKRTVVKDWHYNNLNRSHLYSQVNHVRQSMISIL